MTDWRDLVSPPLLHRVLIVGRDPHEAPLEPGQPALLGSRSGAMIAELCDLPESELTRYFEMVNVWPVPCKQERWDRNKARGRAALLERDVIERRHRTVVLLSRPVADAWQVMPYNGDGYFAWRPAHTCSGWMYSVAPIPHPSGLNRAWNKPSVRASGEEFFRSLVLSLRLVNGLEAA